jgi:hypothetical protein
MIDDENEHIFDNNIWIHKKYKMIKDSNEFRYKIEKDIIIRNIKLKIIYKDCDEKKIFNNIELLIFCKKHVHALRMELSLNNLISSLLGIKNSIYLIPIIQKNLNSYLFFNSNILIKLINMYYENSIECINKVYIEYERLEDASDKKIGTDFFIYYEFGDISNSNVGLNFVYFTNLNFTILTISFSYERWRKKEVLKFNTMILYVNYYDTNTKIKNGTKKIKINYNDLIVKRYSGNIYYIILFDKKTTVVNSIKNIDCKYHKKNKKYKKDKDIKNISEVYFVPDIELEPDEHLNFHFF